MAWSTSASTSPLLKDLARLRPEVHFIILGPVVKIDPATLPQAENIHYLGARSYAHLPEYLSGWDAALLLFALNDATKYISPTKTPEYLAAGKPVVSTPIRDVVRSYGDQGLVRIAAGAEQFALQLDAALAPQSAEWKEAVAAKLDESSWDATWQSMEAEMERVREDHEETHAKKTGLRVAFSPGRRFVSKDRASACAAAPDFFFPPRALTTTWS